MEHLRINIPITKPLVYIDMDGVLSDFDKRFKELEAQGFKGSSVFKHPEAYKDLEPIEGAIAAWHALQEKYETYILSTPAWSNPDSWSEKRIWVEKFLGKSAHKKLILCHHKGLVMGDYLIDDRKANGVGDFKGEHIHFGTEEYPDWSAVLQRLGIIG
jgi:5'(3')-deoxyribonucleotidase